MSFMGAVSTDVLSVFHGLSPTHPQTRVGASTAPRLCFVVWLVHVSMGVCYVHSHISWAIMCACAHNTVHVCTYVYELVRTYVCIEWCTLIYH